MKPLEAIQALGALQSYIKLMRKEFKRTSLPYDRGAAEAYDDIASAIKAIAEGRTQYNAQDRHWEKPTQ